MKKRGLSTVASILLTIGGLVFTTSLAKASSIVLDGDFLDPIGTGGNLTPWSDWTNAGITRQPTPMGIQGNYASMPVGADLFQDFSSLPDGGYVLSFLVRDPSPNSAQLVFGVQQAGGSPAGEVFADGLQEEITVPASGLFSSETLTFYVTNAISFPVDELTFSNSYDAAVGPWVNSINPAGTVVDIADVTLCSLSSYPCGLTPYGSPASSSAVPEPSTWAMMLFGFAGLSFVGYRKRTKGDRAGCAKDGFLVNLRPS
jgi:hypothetical protein